MGADRTITLYPWFQFLNALLFWQAVWFLYFQIELSGAEAIILYSIYDISVTVLEVPSGYFSDRIGRRTTLLISTACSALGCLALAFGGSFAAFAIGQSLIGAGTAFRSGTDSAMLYESLTACGRADEVELQEVRAWRFSLAGFALSAITGGVMSLWAGTLPFYATALSFTLAGGVAFAMSEPPREVTAALRASLASLKDAFTHPVLLWLFALSVLMYGFSHLPFVFGQPFILIALEKMDLSSTAPVVSGGVTSLMMLLSAAVSLIALRLRALLGLPALLLAAFALQIGLVAALAGSTSALVIGLLLLRMVPDSLASPFIRARVQPLLQDTTRATYLSLNSLCGKVLFALTLAFAAASTQGHGLLPADDIQRILGGYTFAGLVCLATLALTARRIAIGSPQKTE